MGILQDLRNIVTSWRDTPRTIDGAVNIHYLQGQDGSMRGRNPVRVESLYAQKSLTGTWTLLQNQQSPMMPVAHIARRGFFGGTAGYITDDSARRPRTTIVAKGLSYKDAFDRIRAAEENAAPLRLTTKFSAHAGLPGIADTTLLEQICPKQSATYWRNLRVPA